MSRRPAERREGGPRLLLSAAALVLALAGLAGLAAGDLRDGSMALRPDVQGRLAELQADWLDWLTAIEGGEEARVVQASKDLVERARETGLERLPELSVAASAKAVLLAKRGLSDRAERGLELAAALDPGRPETAFARAAVARLEGAYPAVVAWTARGWVRVFRIPMLRQVVLSNLWMWGLYVLALAGLAFVGVQMATRGQLLYRDLVQALSRSLPPLLTHLLTLAILLWPAFLPAGLLWLAFFWSLLLWGYGTRVERVIMVTVWLFLGALPFLVSEQTRRMDLLVSRPVRAIESVAADRLQGNLFSDLQILHELLPDSVAVHHLTADLHLRLRQWDRARALYRQVLEAEPSTTSALTDLGTTLFYEGDLESAVAVLEDAVSLPDASAVAYFNLGRAYAEDLHFDKQAPMTQRASMMNDELVRAWLQTDVSERVISEAGGFDRGPEIRRELATVWRKEEADPALIAPWKRVLTLPLALVFILPAIALYALKRQARNRSRRLPAVWWEGRLEMTRYLLTPGIAETEEGRSVAGLARLLLVAALLTVALGATASYTLPLAFAAPTGFVSWLGAAGLVAALLLRWRSAGERTPPKD